MPDNYNNKLVVEFDELKSKLRDNLKKINAFNEMDEYEEIGALRDKNTEILKRQEEIIQESDETFWDEYLMYTLIKKEDYEAVVELQNKIKK